MSYCDRESPATCGAVSLAFHPTQVTTLQARITTNLPSCITAVNANPILFRNGFENPP